jgi:hypothetical protein
VAIISHTVRPGHVVACIKRSLVLIGHLCLFWHEKRHAN